MDSKEYIINDFLEKKDLLGFVIYVPFFLWVEDFGLYFADKVPRTKFIEIFFVLLKTMLLFILCLIVFRIYQTFEHLFLDQHELYNVTFLSFIYFFAYRLYNGLGIILEFNFEDNILALIFSLIGYIMHLVGIVMYFILVLDIFVF